VEWLSESELVVAHRSGRLVVGSWPLLRQNLLGAYGIPCHGAPLLCRIPSLTSPSSPSSSPPFSPGGSPPSSRPSPLPPTPPLQAQQRHTTGEQPGWGLQTAHGGVTRGSRGSWALCEVQQRSGREMVQVLVEEGLLGGLWRSLRPWGGILTRLTRPAGGTPWGSWEGWGRRRRGSGRGED